MNRKKPIAVLLSALLCLPALSALPAAAFDRTRGDLDRNGQHDRGDCGILCDWLVNGRTDLDGALADIDADGRITVKDLSALKQMILYPEQEQPQQPEQPEQPQTHTNASDYMAAVRSSYVTEVPQEILTAEGGELQHITYFSQLANKEKGAFVWLPPAYDASQSYPVMYVNHGIFGNEFSMIADFNIVNSAAGLIQKGEAVPMIIVFTSMYTNPNKDNCDGITAEEEPFYDCFLEDLTECLMPYVQTHYPVKTGRENTAVAGFSMGGRESLYIGIKRADLFGYIAASSPAPGVVPAEDQFCYHPGSMTEAEFRTEAPNNPYLLMIAGGTADGMVQDSPEKYHNLLTANGTEHIWISVPGGGHDGSVGVPLFYNFIRALFKA